MRVPMLVRLAWRAESREYLSAAGKHPSMFAVLRLTLVVPRSPPADQTSTAKAVDGGQAVVE